jgi:hypothetical protein
MKLILKRSILWWLPLPIIGTLNGVLRGFLLNLIFQDFVARQFSSLLMIIWIFIYTAFIYKKLNVQKSVHAWFAGITWLLLTVAFEFILGYFILGSSLESMLADYNLFAGRFWLLVLISILLGPILYFKFGDHGPVATFHKKAT